MPKHNTRPRKGRSSRQAMVTHTRDSLGHFMKSPRSSQHPVHGLRRVPVNNVHKAGNSATIDTLLKESKARCKTLKNSCKSAVQREKRAKEKYQKAKDVADMACHQFSEACRARESAETALGCLQKDVDHRSQEIRELQQQVQELQMLVAEGARNLVLASTGLESQTRQNHKLEVRQKSLYRTYDALRKKVARRDLQVAHSRSALSDAVISHSMKGSDGVITPATRDMIRKLACKGVSTERISKVVDIVAEGIGIEVAGSVSARSVARIMLEGLIQARMQIGHELGQAEYFSICGDGTSINNQQYEARSMYIQHPPAKPTEGLGVSVVSDQPVFRTLGVQQAASHTSKQQLDGWLDALDICCRTLVRSPLGRETHINSKMVAPKLRGILTDHAADQKRFHELILQWKQSCDREIRAVSKLKTMSVEEQLNALSDYLDNAAGSMRNWRDLPPDKQAALMHDAWLALAAKLGQSEFQSLTPDMQFEVDFLAWTGCCMHKELNAVKGGVAIMAAEWKLKSLVRPIALKNKFDAENPSSVIEDRSSRGGIKLASLAGALFRNKDDKKGYQKTVDNYFEKTFGYSNRFPDTSNTRYGSYCNAAAELLLHKETYVQLLKTLHDAKCIPGYTNIELNVLAGLQDIPTLTELAVIALYAQAIGHPYISAVRSTSASALDLGPLHHRVKQHCRAIANNPSLLIGLDASPSSGTLDGNPWNRPEVIYRVLSMAHELPSLQSMLSAFFEGALHTWERFTHEFDDDGTIAQATPEQRRSAWVPPTNDVSEGALGQCRQMLRRAPTMTDEQQNARVMWNRNNTCQWGKQILTDEDKKFVREGARALDASGSSKATRLAFNAALEERAAANRVWQSKAAARKSANRKRLAEIDLLLDATRETLHEKTVKELDCQIDKLREVLGSECMRPKTAIKTKKAKVEAILLGLKSAKCDGSGKNRRRETEGVLEGDDMEVGFTLGVRSNLAEDAEMCFDDEVLLD